MPHEHDKTKGFEATSGQGSSVLILKEGYRIGDYLLLQFLGAGSFGDVWKAERNRDIVALKILKGAASSDEIHRELKSLEALKKLSHRNLLQTNSFWFDGEERLFIEMELADGGSLKDRLIAARATGDIGLAEYELLKYFQDTAAALDYLHGNTKPVLHRDIKPANIVLVNGIAKLADFGLLRQISGDHSATKTQGGTPLYMAPESIQVNAYSVYTDMWSFAVTYAELRQGKAPFGAKTFWQIGERIVKEPPDLTSAFHPEEKQVLLRALSKDPRRRYPTCGEFVYELTQAIPAEFRNRPGEAGAPKKPARPASPKTLTSIDLISETNRQNQSTEEKTQRGKDTSVESRPARPTDHEIRVPAILLEPPSRPEDEPSVQVLVPEAEIPPVLPEIAPPKPLWTPPQPAHLRTLSMRRVIGMVLAVSAIMGLWLYFSRGAVNRVNTQIADGRFADAVQSINDAGRFLLPFQKRNLEAVETGWLASLQKTARDNEHARRREPLLDELRSLKRFHELFPENDTSKKLMLDVQRRLNEFDAVVKVPPNLDPPEKHHERFVALLKDSQSELAGARLEMSWQKLKQARTLTANFKASLEDKQLLDRQIRELGARLTARALDVNVSKKNAREALGELKTLAEFAKDTDFAIDANTSDQLDAHRSLAHIYNGDITDGFEIYRSLLGKNQAKRLQPHTLALLNLNEGLTKLPTAIMDSSSVEIQMIGQLTKVYRGQASPAELIRFLKHDLLPAEVQTELWLTLARVDAKTGGLKLADLDALEAALPTGEITPAIARANSGILTRVLEPLAKESHWFAKEERLKCVRWCQRIESPSDWIRALQTECQIEASQAVKIDTFPGAGAYGSYVRALTLEQNKKPHDAGNEIAKLLQSDAKGFRKGERLDRATKLLQAEFAGLARKGKSKEFATEKDAQRYLDWQPIVEKGPRSEPQRLASLIDTAFAAVKTNNASKLTQVDAELGKLSKPGDQATGYYWLAMAYWAKAGPAKEVLAHFDRALKLGNPAEEVWTSAVEQRADYALTNLKGAELEAAAEANSQLIQKQVSTLLAGGVTNKAKAFAVYSRAIPAKLDLFYVPVVVEKLTRVSSPFYFDEKPDLSINLLEKSVAEGNTALALLKSDAKLDKNWARTLKTRTSIRLADANFVLLDLKTGVLKKEYADKKQPLPVEEVKEFMKKLGNLVPLYEVEHASKPTPVEAAELSYKIGGIHAILGDFNSDKATMESALKELKTSEPYTKTLSSQRKNDVAFLIKYLTSKTQAK